MFVVDMTHGITKPALKTAGLPWSSQSYLWFHLPTDPCRAQGVPRESRQRRCHLHKACRLIAETDTATVKYVIYATYTLLADQINN